jgi:hypothetical protein
MNKERLKHYASKVKSDAYGLDRTIIARIAGVTFEGRQELLKAMCQTTEVYLERDRRNKFDFYAVKVMAKLGPGEDSHVGFIPGAMSKLISKSLDNGVNLDTKVSRITGGMENAETGERLHFGLEIKISPPSITNR